MGKRMERKEVKRERVIVFLGKDYDRWKTERLT